MEEGLKLLLVLAFIGIAIAKQVRKETGKNSGQGPDIPTPSPGHPLPEYWGGDIFDSDDREGNTRESHAPSDSTYGGYIPQGPAAEDGRKSGEEYRYEGQTVHRMKPQAKHKAKRPTEQPAAPNAATHHHAVSEPETDGTSEYAIRSAEEARRAIIWSEILQRKY